VAVAIASALATVPAYVCVVTLPFASVTLTVKLYDPPAPVGVPLIAPVEEFSVKPAGSAPPVIANVSGPRPPAVWIVCEYG
jgi:hypothetical protein